MQADVELVSTGNELLDGRIVNTHARDLAAALADLGFRLTRDTTVPDDQAAIRGAVADALQRVDIVVVSGGLGPTSDDVTRDAVAALAGARLVMHEPSRLAIVDWYARRQRPLNDSTERHALVVEGAEVLPNPAGLAPGEELRIRGKLLYLMPGPPHEFLAILREHVVPRLARAAGGLVRPEVRLFQVCGIGESDMVSRWSGEEFPGPGVDVAYCAKTGRVEVRLWASPSHRAALERAADMVRARVGTDIYAEGPGLLEEVVGAQLRARRWRLAVAESCTGGLLSHRLTNVSGSSGYLLGGIVAYDNGVKVRELGVDAGLIERVGAVSESVARAMAEGVRGRLGADVGVGVTGIAGPAGGGEAKPVGLVYIAVADAAGTVAREFRLSGPREIIKEWSAQMALDLLRRRLAGLV